MKHVLFLKWKNRLKAVWKVGILTWQSGMAGFRNFKVKRKLITYALTLNTHCKPNGWFVEITLEMYQMSLDNMYYTLKCSNDFYLMTSFNDSNAATVK